MRKRIAHGPAIRAFREAGGLSVSAFAPRVGISQSYMSRIELGDKQPTPDLLRRIARELGVKLDVVSYIEHGCPTCEQVAA